MFSVHAIKAGDTWYLRNLCMPTPSPISDANLCYIFTRSSNINNTIAIQKVIGP